MKTAIVKASALALGLAALPAAPAQAQDRMLAEVFVFAGNFCPRGTLPADGRLLEISTNTALFSLLGTKYGGDGRTTFALPNLDGMDDRDGREVRFCIVTQGIYPSRS
ncbi:phage tail protein [Erythrobacter sp.]|uniref:phage tail protein n=1 Tax=Erythrobacter sp. TaxID=1042 RepID=UPI001425DA0E|nr:tail fiber protein [Erythrobacter sp.]QIQ85538.1 MAG: tail fiber protein [Erythrobacter sp.]